MTTIAQKNGKFIIKDGRLVLGDPNDSECGCCECCWRITELAGCPSPEVAIEDNTKISISFRDSENSTECDPEPCKTPTNALTSTSDKTRCGATQLVKMTTKWAIKETTSVTVSLSGNVETKDKGYDKTTVILKKCADSQLSGCGVSASAGGEGVTINTYTYEPEEKELEFTYDAYSIPDAFLVEGGGNTFVDTGSVSGAGAIVFCKPADVTEITVTVTGPNGTAWDYGIGCPELWARGAIYSGCGVSKDLEGDQNDYKQISISSTTVANDTACNMANVSNSKTFELEPGCWKVEVLSSTVDGLHHIDMWANVEFSFGGEAPECSEKMCTTFECEPGTGSGNASGGSTGATNPDGSGGSGGGGSATSSGGLYGTCKAKEYDPESSEPYVELLDCLSNCDSDSCVNSFYYCCVEGRCKAFKTRVCTNEDPSVECSSDGPQFCTIWECLSSPECTPEALVCQTGEDEIKSCVPWDPANDAGLALYGDQATCEANLEVGGSACQQTVSGNWVITYNNIQICRPECEEGYVCNENVECEPSLARDSDYVTYEECLEGCIPTYSCMPNQGCARDIDGPYNTLEECLQECTLDPDPNSYYCCYDKPIDEDPTSVACVLGGCRDEDGVHTPQRVAGGPYKAQNQNISQAMCAEFCRKHSCGPCASCVGDANGEYLSKTECEKGGRGKPACKETFDPDAPCEINGPTISSYVNPQFPNQIPGSKRNETELYFTIGASKQTVCIDILNKTRKPKAAILFYPRLTNCVETGLSSISIYNNKANTGRKFIGAEECDCDARGSGSLDTSRDQVFISWKKAEGVKWFKIRIVHPCELPGDIFDYEITCSDKCNQPKNLGKADPEGACCTTDENGVVTCQENIPESFCQGANEKFAICADCDPDPCEEKRGACCGGPNQGGCEDHITETDCLKSNGIFYENERCRSQIFPDGVVCDGLCCIKEWKYVGSVKVEEIDAVDEIVVRTAGQSNEEATEIEEWIDENGIVYCATATTVDVPACEGGTVEIETRTKKVKVLKILNKQAHEANLIDCTDTIPDYLDDKIATDIIKSITLPTITCSNIEQISSVQKEKYVLITKESENANTVNIATEYSPPYHLTKTDVDAYTVASLADISTTEYNDLPSIVTVPLSEIAIVERSNDPFIADETNKYHVYISCYRECEANTSKDRCADYDATKPNKPLAEYLVRGVWHYAKCTDEEDFCENNDVVEPAVAQAQRISFNPPFKIRPQSVVVGQSPKAYPAKGGAGTELKKLLGMIGIRATEGCSCNSRAKTMDQWGPDLCEQNIATIIDWLKQEAKKRGLPFVDRIAILMVKRAIHNARKKLDSN